MAMRGGSGVDPSASDDLEVSRLSRILETLGNQTRLRIVALLSYGPVGVDDLKSALDVTPSKASRQLAMLRAAGLVEPRHEGSRVLYDLAPQPDPLCRKLLAALIASFDDRDLLRSDAERLRRSKAPTSSQHASSAVFGGGRR